MMSAPTLLEAVTSGVGTERPFLCPVHADTRPSASVNILKMVWYCLPPSTRVLTTNLRWVELGTVENGDLLAGFDEHAGKHRRSWRSSEVLETKRVIQPCYKITLETGEKIISSAKHMWLVKSPHGLNWKSTDELLNRNGNFPKMYRLTDTWEEPDSYDAGYVAAGFDGEGYLQQNTEKKNMTLGFYQRDNAMWDQTILSLDNLNIKYKEYPYYSSKNNKLKSNFPLRMIHIRKRPEAMKFLGATRPPRLLEKFDFDSLGCIAAKDMPQIVSVEFVGEREVVAIKTSTRTFVAEGFASHNCYTCGAHGRVEGEALAGDPNFTAVNEYINSMMAETIHYSEGWLNQFDAAGPGEYWLGRFSSSACAHFRLGQDMVDQTPVYPLRDAVGRVLGVVRRTGLATGPKYLYPKGIDIGKLLFNYRYESQGTVVLVEGAADAIACWEAGVEALAIYGSRLSNTQQELIERLEPDRIICAFDNDEAGYRAFTRVRAMFRSVPVKRLSWTGGKDIADLSVTRRKEVFDMLAYDDHAPVVSDTCSSPRKGTQKRKTLSPAIGALSWP